MPIKTACLFILLLLTGLQPSMGQSQGKKPNIILIVADDLGWKDLGFMGSAYYDTPNLDKLARQGIYFTQAYAGAANCAPSRACLMSGQNTPRHGIFTVGEPGRGEEANRKLIPSDNREDLDEKHVTLAEALKAAGYYTATVGKWHLGKDPRSQGFDYNLGGNHRGANKHFAPYKNPDIPEGPEGEYLTDRLTTEAIKVVESQKAKPFFLYLPYYAVHTPIQAPDNLIARYKQKKPAPGQSNATYAAMISSLDTNIGRLMQKLEALKLADNTLVIFTSDNGGIRSISEQTPLRAGKGSYYEGGIRVPLVMRWPAKIKGGTRNATPVTNLDFYPTILETLQLKNKNAIQDGTSLWPVLQGKTLAERPLYWHFPIYLQAYDTAKDDGRDPVFRTRPGSAMRLGKWKLHEYFEDGALELYDLEQDLGERNNVAAKYPEVSKKMHQMLQDWRRETKAPVPTTPNPDYNPQAQAPVKTKKQK